jgi:hypothetical protein
MSDTQLQPALDAPEIVCGVTADQKLRVVAALQRQRCIVAVTGDGVNDAPWPRACGSLPLVIAFRNADADVSACRHLGSNLLDLRPIERSRRRRENLLILDPDVLLVERLEARQAFSKLLDVGLVQAIVRQPLMHEFVDGRVMPFRFVMVVFEPVQ